MSKPGYTFDAAIPYSEDAEQALIGALLNNAQAYYKIGTLLSDADFFLPRHGLIYAAVKALTARSDAVDYLTIAEHLKAAGKVGEIGGYAYLLQLVNATPTSAHVETYARLVQRAAYRRRIMRSAETLRALAIDETIAVEDVREKASAEFLRAIETGAERRVKTAKQAAGDYIELCERMITQQQDMIGIPCGYADVDRMTYGAQPGQMIVVAGRPAMGKTSFVIAQALNMAKGGHSVVLWTGEMSEAEYTHRIISALSGVPLAKVKNAALASAAEQQSLLDGADKFYHLPIVIDDTPRITLPGLYMTALEYKARGMADVIILDQIGLMAYPELDRSSDETLRISRLSTGIKNLAREVELPVIVVSQLNRGVDSRADKRPMLSDLRQSGAIEQDADVVMFLYRDEVYNPATETPNQCDVIVGKNRNGATGTAYLFFDKERATFKPLARQDVDLRANGHAPAAPTHASKTEPF
jgi:replicative DNA helicase